MIFFDAHVHIQTIFSLDDFFFSARENFSNQLSAFDSSLPTAFFLLLAEAKGCSCFIDLKHQATSKKKTFSQKGWRILATEEEESLLVVHDNWPNDRLFLVAGRQIVTAERLEVLALATTMELADGASLRATVDAIRQQKGLAVLPWGVGKWLGQRGKILGSFLKDASPDRLFVGDNGGRPKFWPTPSQFVTAAARGIRLLPGSDPLPLCGEELRVGSYGAMLEEECSSDHPVADLKALLTGSTARSTTYGKQSGTLPFLQNQIALRLKKR